ncbi:MAG: helix-turn-helix transcriptional regulator [Chloroflexi bacterium]|nr:helix-turn-helix transcriptional regulator [Chloroflexota bacterium]
MYPKSLLKITYHYDILKETEKQVEKFKLGDFLKKKREEQRLTVRQLAMRTNSGNPTVTASQISKIENDRVNPGFLTLQRIAIALDLPLAILLEGSLDTPDAIAVLTKSEVVEALNRPKLLELILYCYQLNDEQLEAIVGVARSIHEFTKPSKEVGTVE